MGQSCSFAQQQQGHNPYRQQKTHMNVDSGNKRKLLQSYILKQRQSIKQVTLIEGAQQLIYEFHNSHNAVVKLPVNSWDAQKQQIQDIEIEEFLADGVSFICRVKYYYQNYPVWRVVRVVKGIKGEGLNEFAMLYYRFYQIRGIQQETKSFIFADKCFLQTNKHNTTNNQLSHSFIIQSQFSLFPFVPLRSLGFFMKFNHICWQDGEFLSIIQKSLNLISVSKKNGTFLFQEWLIDKNGEVFSIGTLVQKLSYEEQLLYLQELTLYLCECLYGQKLTAVISYQQLKAILEQKQKASKYKHPQSISSLLKLYQTGIIQNNQKSKQSKIIKQKTQHKPNIIHHYVDSYRAKRRIIQSCAELAIIYNVLGQSEKERKILYERLSVLVYQLMGGGQNGMRENKDKMIGLENMDAHKLRSLKNILKHDTMSELHIILSHLIRLQRQLSSHSSRPSPHLQHLLNQYLHISIILSSHLRHSHQPHKSLSILLQARQFLQEIQSWQLELHIAMCYFYGGDFQQSQLCLQRSLGIDANQSNVCFIIMFYANVLNWQLALQYLQQHQSLLPSQNPIYNMLFSKIFLSKSLCIAKHQPNDQQRVELLYETINIASKVLDSKCGPEVVLMQAYEIVGDAYFYVKHYPTAREFYRKALAICGSIEFVKTTKQQHTSSSYQPAYMRSASLQYTRSRSIYESKHHQSHLNSISKATSTVLKNSNTHKQQPQQQHTQTHNPQSFLYQLNLLFDSNKQPMLLSSIANCYFMQEKFTQAIKFYKQAQSKLPKDSNKDMRNSIIGNLALCEVQMVKSNTTNKDANVDSIQQCKMKLEKIMDQTRDQDPSKLENDVNYIFLLNELNSI